MILSWVRIFNWYRNRKINLEIFYQHSISSLGLFTMNEEHFPWWRKKIGLLRLQHVKAKNIIGEGRKANTEDIFYIKCFNFPFLSLNFSLMIGWFFESLNFQWFWCRLNKQSWILELQTISTNLISLIN